MAAHTLKNRTGIFNGNDNMPEVGVALKIDYQISPRTESVSRFYNY